MGQIKNTKLHIVTDIKEALTEEDVGQVTSVRVGGSTELLYCK